MLEPALQARGGEELVVEGGLVIVEGGFVLDGGMVVDEWLPGWVFEVVGADWLPDWVAELVPDWDPRLTVETSDGRPDFGISEHAGAARSRRSRLVFWVSKARLMLYFLYIRSQRCLYGIQTSVFGLKLGGK